jgi:hypothetical protein
MNDSFEGNGSAATAPDFGVPYSTRREKLHARGKKNYFNCKLEKLEKYVPLDYNIYRSQLSR